MRIESAVAVALGALLASGAVLAQPAATSGALAAPAKGKAATPAASANVKPGAGGGPVAAPAPSPELAAAIASGNVRRALELGASARDIVLMKQRTDPNMTIDPDRALFVRAPNGQFAIAGFNLPPRTDRSLSIYSEFTGFTPPGGLESLPDVYEALGPPNASPVSNPLSPVGQMALSGATAADIAAAVVATRAQVLGAPTFDPSSARFIQDPSGGVAVVMIRSDGFVDISALPGTQGFSGLASLPTMQDVVPGLRVSATQRTAP